MGIIRASYRAWRNRNRPIKTVYRTGQMVEPMKWGFWVTKVLYRKGRMIQQISRDFLYTDQFNTLAENQ